MILIKISVKDGIDRYSSGYFPLHHASQLTGDVYLRPMDYVTIGEMKDFISVIDEPVTVLNVHPSEKISLDNG